MFAPENFQHVGEKKNRLDEKTYAKAVSYGVKGQSEGRCHFFGPVQVTTHNNKIPAGKKEKKYGQASRGHIDHISMFFPEFIDDCIYVDMSSHPCSVGNGKTYNDPSGEGDELVRADNRFAKGTHNDFTERDDHHKNERGPCKYVRSDAQLRSERDKSFHLIPPVH
jgi:hypothetical protein